MQFLKKHTKAVVVTAVSVAVVALLAFVFAGSTGIALRFLAGSLPAKLFLVTVALSIVAGIVTARYREARYRYSWRRGDDEVKAPSAAPAVSLWITVTVVTLGLIASVPMSGYLRGVATNEATTVVQDPQGAYDWRTPWVTASQAASSKAGNVVGDFLEEETTYLPALDAYATPVAGRGFATGTTAVVMQTAGGAVETCEFTSPAPRFTGGWFGANFNRALTFVNPTLSAYASDAWVYCTPEGEARMVVPVFTAIAVGVGVPTPAGVVVFGDGEPQHITEVAPGTFPGPVYPESIAAAQRDATSASSGIADAVFGRAGFETTEDIDGDPNNGNPSELLLARATGDGFDFVSPLSPRGKSFTITAVSSVPADRVVAGQFNDLTIHTLSTPREGNLALADRVKAAFPQLGWASGLTVVEIVPTTADTWEATLTNGRVVTNRVLLNADGSLCLTTPSGVTTSCVDASGGAQQPSDATGASSSGVPGSLGELTDEQLAQLAVDVANEQLARSRR